MSTNPTQPGNDPLGGIETGPPVHRIRHLIDIGRTDEAIELLGDALSSQPSSVPMLRLLARAEHQRDRFDEAIAAAQAALAIEPDAAGSLIILANSLASKPGHTAHLEAMDAANAAVTSAPHWPPTFATRGRIWATWAAAPIGTVPYRSRQCFEAALADTDRALELDPTNATTLGFRGWVLLKLGRRSEAKSTFSRALEIDPNDAYAQSQLAELAFAEERLGTAREHARSAVGIDPQSTALRKQVGRLALRRLLWPIWFASIATVVAPRPASLEELPSGRFFAPLPLVATVVSFGFAWWTWKRMPMPERSALVSGSARSGARIAVVAWLFLTGLGIAHAFIAPFAFEPQYVNRPRPGLAETLWSAGLAAFFLIPFWVGFQKVAAVFETGRRRR